MANKKQTSRRKSNPSGKKKKAGKKSGRVTTIKKNPQSVKNAVSAICSISDPFCIHAYGAKGLSGSSARTLAYQWHSRRTLTTDATGSAAVLYAPGYVAVSFPATVAAGIATYTTSHIDAPSLSATTYRIVSWGLKIRRICAPLSSAGMLRVRGFATTHGSYLETIPTATYNCDVSEDIALQDAKEVCIVGRRIDQTHGFMRMPTDTNQTTQIEYWRAPGWCCYQIAIEGGPVSVATLDIEIFINYEVAFEDTSSMGLLTTTAPPPNPVASAAADVVYNAGKGIFSTGLAAASRWIENKAAMAIGSYFGGPAGAMAMRAITVD